MERGGLASAVIHDGEVVRVTEIERQQGIEVREKVLDEKRESGIMEAVVENTGSTEIMVSVSESIGHHVMKRQSAQRLLLHHRVAVRKTIWMLGLMPPLLTVTMEASALTLPRRHREKRYRKGHLRVQTRVHARAGKGEKAEKVALVARRQKRPLERQIVPTLNGLLLRCRQHLCRILQ